ncbi:uncharacterized protein [Blastocystis hominis]|uniref:Uncharacterized protein n=1 Tax=Blastocystis hominis TaxID=12968 RepID=D8M9T2_BLAHO|nr:uncharacterized protein [Blastocystis hominis]CBK24821.2 unnamed protein product [Blastocystis hominis]|eukprot:XP_012898869.1 uncharacterized protein [Blastocystis hominis]
MPLLGAALPAVDVRDDVACGHGARGRSDRRASGPRLRGARGGDRDREEQEREEGREPAPAREEPEEPAAGGEAKRGRRGGRGEENEPAAAERRGGGSDERRGAADLRGAERGGHRAHDVSPRSRADRRGRGAIRRRDPGTAHQKPLPEGRAAANSPL